MPVTVSAIPADLPRGETLLEQHECRDRRDRGEHRREDGRDRDVDLGSEREQREASDLDDPAHHDVRDGRSRDRAAPGDQDGDGDHECPERPGRQQHPRRRERAAHETGQVEAGPEHRRRQGGEAGGPQRPAAADADALLDFPTAARGREDDADRDQAEDRAGARRELLTGQDRDDRSDGALGRGDRRDDAHRADTVGRVGQEQAAHVGRTRERGKDDRVGLGRRERRGQEGEGEDDHQSDEHRARHGHERPRDPAGPGGDDGRDGERERRQQAGQDRDHRPFVP